MNREEIKDKVFILINKHFRRSDCSEDVSLISDWGATSIDDVELYMSLEDLFGVDINDGKPGRLLTVGSIIDQIYKGQNG